MGDRPVRKRTDTRVYAQTIVRHAINYPELRDEVYGQLCKQTLNNPNEYVAGRCERLTTRYRDSCVRGWRLIVVCCGCFVPSGEYLKTFRRYLGLHEKSRGAIGGLAQFASERLTRTLINGPRAFPPSLIELAALFRGQPTIIRVHFLDDSFKSLDVDSSSTSKEVCQGIAYKIRLKQHDGFVLYQTPEEKGTSACHAKGQGGRGG